eukprot:29639-Pyramimonas_sp.AAC.1
MYPLASPVIDAVEESIHRVFILRKGCYRISGMFSKAPSSARAPIWPTALHRAQHATLRYGTGTAARARWALGSARAWRVSPRPAIW